MDMREFEKAYNNLCTIKDDKGVQWLEESLKIYPLMDGCLGASFRGEAIACEGVDWDVALELIIQHIEDAVKQDVV